MKKLLPLLLSVTLGCSVSFSNQRGDVSFEFAGELGKKEAISIAQKYLQSSPRQNLFNRNLVRLYSMPDFNKEFKNSFQQFDDCLIVVFDGSNQVHDLIRKYVVAVNKKTKRVEYAAIGYFSYWSLVWTFKEM